MIRSIKDLQYYLACDKIALKIPSHRKFPRPIIDVIWKYEILLRKTEFHLNNKGIYHRVFQYVYRLRLIKLGNKLTIKIAPNVFGAGLSIAHFGSIIVNSTAKVGVNCRIHECVTIGATNGNSQAAIIGDNCFIGSGAKIIGSIKIADDVAIGAGAVVVSDIIEQGISVGGVPAKRIGYGGSKSNVRKATEQYCKLNYEN